MKKSLLLLFYFFLSLSGFAQKLTLAELTSLCDKQNWETVNTTLLAKGWVYYESKKGDSFSYNTITWSYNKEYYSDKANAWFELYTYDGQPNKVSYTVFNKPAYTTIQNSLSPSGYKLTGSAIEDNELVSTYANNTHLVKINTAKREEDDWSDRSHTAYRITVIKKAGVYDPDNGKKFSYFDNGELESEYMLKNGELHGQYKAYYEDGQLKREGIFANGKGNGRFVEYDEEGNKAAEYAMLNGEVHGLAKIYEGGLLSEEKEYVNGVQTGKYTDYYYNSDTGELSLKLVGSTVDGKKEGKWISYFVAGGKEEPVEYWHYKDGLKHGEVEEFIGSDTIETASYAYGKLHGPYKRQVKQELYASKTGKRDYVWFDDCEGSYDRGLKSGKWTYYTLFSNKMSEGNYKDGLEEGKWLFYVTLGKRTGEVILESNFVAGQKHGLETRYFYIDEVAASPDDDLSTVYKAVPISARTHYRNGVRHGEFEYKDSTNTLIAKGIYVNGEKDGLWMEGFEQENLDGTSSWLYFSGNYKNGNEEGKWLSYIDRNLILKTLNYRSGALHGEYISWNQVGKPSERKVFDNGKLTELTVYDSAGEKVMTKYEVYNENSSSLMCRRSEYFDDKVISQEYRIFRQEDIHHNDFEQVFLNLTGITSSSIYGYKDGEYKVTTPGGEPLVKGRHYKEERVGQWTFFFPEQGLRIESNYSGNTVLDEKYLTSSNGLFTGNFVFHNAETGLKEERKIKNGLRDGKTTYLDSNNKAVKKETYKAGVLK